MGCLGGCILGWWTSVGPQIVATVRARCARGLLARRRGLCELFSFWVPHGRARHIPCGTPMTTMLTVLWSVAIHSAPSQPWAPGTGGPDRCAVRPRATTDSHSSQSHTGAVPCYTSEIVRNHCDICIHGDALAQAKFDPALKYAPLALLWPVTICTGGGGEFRGGNFPRGKFRISTWCGIFPSFFEGGCGIFPMRNFACVSHRRTRLGFFLGVIMLNKGANVCWCLISSKAQACGYALQYFPPLVVCQNAKLCCIVCLLGIAIPGSPLFAMHSRFGRCGIFPLIFWDRCGIFPVRNFPLRKNPRTEIYPPPVCALQPLHRTAEAQSGCSTPGKATGRGRRWKHLGPRPLWEAWKFRLQAGLEPATPHPHFPDRSCRLQRHFATDSNRLPASGEPLLNTALPPLSPSPRPRGRGNPTPSRTRSGHHRSLTNRPLRDTSSRGHVNGKGGWGWGGQRCVDSKNSQTTPATTNTTPNTPTTGRRSRANGTSRHIQHSPNTPTTGLRERGNDTSRSTGRSGRQNTATQRNMRREERVTVQGPVKEHQPDGMSHRGRGGGGAEHSPAAPVAILNDVGSTSVHCGPFLVRAAHDCCRTARGPPLAGPSFPQIRPPSCEAPSR